MTRLLILIIILSVGLGCASIKGPYTYEICVPHEAAISRFLSNNMIGIADTTVAFLSGQTIDLKSNQAIRNVIISLDETTTREVYHQSTDSLGKFSMIVPAGEYIFDINHIGYSSIKTVIKIGTGEMRDIIVELADGPAFVTYEIKSDKKLSQKQLNNKAEELKIRD
ncbi:carboxypeptidase-like regulatory domain-containing protein [Crocinitomix catalasitica]|uniref:carboxypeptidase-like regulatory domain-containing protein n=1 Tax=Crocinitomix catalasitica TaxID=184607 RepID=UPI0012F8CB38|nr:carboxypeptidase-like regulatory domain-containing protein [Crocinitomix catalasitica]